MLEAIANQQPELEHLAIDPCIKPSPFSIEALLRMERLVSVEVYLHWNLGLKWSNGWIEALAEKGRLEHLVVDGFYTQVDAVLGVISKCRVSSMTVIAEGIRSICNHVCCRACATSQQRGKNCGHTI